MATMTDLIEYLLALRTPEGGAVVRYGVMLTTVPLFPPGMSITFTLTPYFDAFANIEYWHRFSPSIVPGTILWESSHSGMEIHSGLIRSIAYAEGHNAWLEITDANPIITTITNVSGVNQFFETFDFFLLVDNEENFKVVKDVVSNWGAFATREQFDETNRLLRALVKATPGAEQVLQPKPPIGGG